MQKLMAWDMNDRTDSFINRLKSGKIKHLISIENYSSGKRTIEIYESVFKLKSRLKETNAFVVVTRNTPNDKVVQLT